MSSKLLIRTAIAACCLGGCGSRPHPAAETKAAAAVDVTAPPRSLEVARDDDRLLREVERTVATPVPRPMLPLLELESGGPAEGIIR